MSDDLILVGLILILGNKIRSAGKCDLVDIFLHLVRRHTDTVIGDFDRLFLGMDLYVDPRLKIIRQGIFPHHIQLFQLCDRVASVGDQLPIKNILIGIQPLFNNRKNIIAVN